MRLPEKNQERFQRTIVRTIVTTTLITIILMLSHLFPGHQVSKSNLFGIVWTMIFSIVFTGHWLEIIFINYLKFKLPLGNLALLYFTRIIYWFISAIPLYMLANVIRGLLTNQGFRLGNWWIFGFFYILLELFFQAVIHFRLKKSFYNGVY